MRLNKSVAISTDKVLLVPYDHHHVLTYHGWMEDPAIQEATASERLTLEEEYENQESWRASHDKMTFIVCQPVTSTTAAEGQVLAGVVDTPEKMMGDINLFLSPYDDDDDETQGSTNTYVGEVDIMIANVNDQGKGTGRAAVLAFLQYVSRNLGDVLGEYCEREQDHDGRTGRGQPKLVMLMAKINKDNLKSIALFKSLGFEQDGDVNFFGEVKLVLRGFRGKFCESVGCPDGYRELVYVRGEGGGRKGGNRVDMTLEMGSIGIE